MTYTNKKIIVCGMGISGIAAARLLLRHGATITLCDLNPDPKVDKELLAHPNISTYFGKNPDDILDKHDMLVLSPGIPCDLPFVVTAKKMDMPVWGEVELAYRHSKAPIIGITGTNGKTTVTSLVYDIVKLAHPSSVLVGNIGIPFCDMVETLEADNAFIVAEISSFQLETIDRFAPKISAVLNMTPDHLNRHKTMEAYVEAKERIFKNQAENDICVLNFNNSYTKAMASKTKAEVIFFNQSPEGELVLPIADIPIPGKHNLENVLAAIAICKAAGISDHIIRQGIVAFKAVEHRLEFIKELDGVRYYNDSKATNIDSTIKAIQAFNSPIILIAGGQDKDLDFNDLVKHFPENVKRLIAIGETADALIQTCKAHSYFDTEQANTIKDAVHIAFLAAKKGDIVLLSPACASYDMFDNFEQRGSIFKSFVYELS